MKHTNSKGQVWYGLHMYPGVCEYRPKGIAPYRVLLLEDTLRRMDASFAGCPVFLYHRDEQVVDQPIDILKREADGLVSESFYNEADGKHWVKFITMSEKADQALSNGMTLSNCYVGDTFAPGGLWNNVEYQREVTDATYEHLAIVPDPRYAESIVLTPEEFKAYNERKRSELAKFQNNLEEAEPMFFNRKKVEADKAKELETLSVVLPKSKREVDVLRLINEADEREAAKGQPTMAHGEHLVEVNGGKMTVNELVEKHKTACNELEELKKKGTEENDDDGAGDDAGETQTENAEDKPAEDKPAEDKPAPAQDRKTNAGEGQGAKGGKDKPAAAAPDPKAKERADRVRNARGGEEAPVVLETSQAQVARGRERYG